MTSPRAGSAQVRAWPRRPGPWCTLVLLLLPAPARATWSIVAVDPQTHEVGAAGASCVDGVIRIAGLAPGKGVVASQAASSLAGRDRAVARLEEGVDPAAILAEITAAAFDTNARRRQYGIAAFSGPPAGFTGSGNSPWAGHAQGANVSVQGNILVGEQVVAEALAAFQAEGDCSVRLSDRLMAALQAGGQQGGDSRCDPAKAAISAFLLVARPDDSEPSLHLEALAPDGDPGNPVTDLQAQYDRWRQSQPVRACPDAGASHPRDAAPMVNTETPPVARRAGGCAVGGGRPGGLLLLVPFLLWRRRRIFCAAAALGETRRRAMRWGLLAVVTLGCSLRNLDDLSSGSAPPADADHSAPDSAPPAVDSAASGPDSAGSGQTLFWVDSGDRSVHSATIDGSGAKRLAMLPAPSYLRSIAVDAAHQKIYFSDSGLKKIVRANFDGSAMEDAFTGLDVPVGLDLDAAAGKIYFADQGVKPTIFRANLDGSGKEAIIAAGITHPYGLVLDRAGARLFFVDNGVHAIFHAGLDGTALTRLNIAGVGDPIEVAIDPREGRIYWSELGVPPKIRRANLDGSGAEDVITQAAMPALSTPLGVAVDVLARKLYWVDGGNGTLDVIQRAELDGSGAHAVVLGLSAPRGLAIGY